MSTAKTSNYPFDETVSRLQSSIESRGLTIFAKVDHAAGAEAAGLTLAPSTLFIFGNPQAGTPLMQAAPELGLDLPLKALVYEEAGTVNVLTSDINAITARAGVSNPAPVIERIGTVLKTLAGEATGTTP
ncbi:MAG: DUF302 domain-containing protein [Pseudomonadota bacterium]